MRFGKKKPHDTEHLLDFYRNDLPGGESGEDSEPPAEPEPAPRKRKTEKPADPERPKTARNREEPAKKQEPAAEEEAEEEPPNPAGGEPSLVRAPRTSKGTPKKFHSLAVKEKLAKIFFVAWTVCGLAGLLYGCSTLLSLASPDSGQTVISPPDDPSRENVAETQAVAHLEGRFADMLPAMWLSDENGEGFLKVQQIQLLEDPGYERSVEVYDFWAETKPSGRRGASSDYWNVKVRLGRDTLSLAAPVEVTAAAPLSADSRCSEVEVPERDREIVEEWADAWLKGDNDTLFRIAGEDDPEVAYPGWDDTQGYMAEDVVSITSPCPPVSGENVFTVGVRAVKCDDTQQKLELYANILMEAAGTPNPQITGWDSVGSMPVARGFAQGAASKSEDAQDCEPETDSASALPISDS